MFPTLIIPLPHLLLPFPLNSLLSLLFHFSPVPTTPHPTTPHHTPLHYTTPTHQTTHHTTPHQSPTHHTPPPYITTHHRHHEGDIRYRLLGAVTPPLQQFKIIIKSPTQKKISTNLGPGYGTYGDVYSVLTGAEVDSNYEGKEYDVLCYVDTSNNNNNNNNNNDNGNIDNNIDDNSH